MKAYAVLHEGQLVGPFLDEHLSLKGVWNIQWLCIAEALESLRSYEGDTGNFPVSFQSTPAVVGASLQLSDGRTLGEWAEELRPTAWIDRAMSVPNFILAAVYPLWEVVARGAADAYTPVTNNNLYVVDFTTRRLCR